MSLNEKENELKSFKKANECLQYKVKELNTINMK